jgi:hypothetical protein
MIFYGGLLPIFYLGTGFMCVDVNVHILLDDQGRPRLDDAARIVSIKWESSWERWRISTVDEVKRTVSAVFRHQLNIEVEDAS